LFLNYNQLKAVSYKSSSLYSSLLAVFLIIFFTALVATSGLIQDLVSVATTAASQSFGF
jgi:hypothetical protein